MAKTMKWLVELSDEEIIYLVQSVKLRRCILNKGYFNHPLDKVLLKLQIKLTKSMENEWSDMIAEVS